MHTFLRMTLPVALGIVTLCLGVVSARAGNKDNPSPQAGFTHSPAFSPDDSPQRHGLVLAGQPVVRASPVIANISTASTGNEIAIVSSDGILSVYPNTGVTPLWTRDIYQGATTCSPVPGDVRLSSSPAVGDLENDGVPDLVVGYGTLAASSCDGGVVALNGNTGAVKWRYSLRDLAKIPENSDENLFGVISTPALADTDSDGQLEVAFGGFDRNFHLLNSDGSQRWYYHAADTIWASATFLNVDGDSALEVIFATDISADPDSVPPTQDGGYLYAFDTQPRVPVSVPFREGYLWQTYFDQTLYASPAIGDVLASNLGPEIVQGASCFFPIGNTNKNGKWIKILRPSDGIVLSTLNLPHCSSSSPTLGDIDDDGKLGVVTIVTGAASNGGDGASDVIAIDPDTGAQKWSRPPIDANSSNNDVFGDDIQSVVLADVDGTGSLEVVVANFWSVHILRGDTGVPLTCQYPCGSAPSLFAWYTVKSTPAIGDLDGDGDLEIAIGGSHIFRNGNPPPASGPTSGLLYVWTNLAAAGLGSPAGMQPAYSAPWPQWRAGSARTGVVAIPALATSVTTLYLFDSTGNAGTLQGAFDVINAGGGTLNWSIAADPGLTPNPNSGNTASHTTVSVQAIVGAATPGQYTLGTVTLSSTNGTGSPQTITVQRLVGPLTFLPLVRK